MSQRIVPCLPAPLRDHVAYAGIRNDRVLLLVHSPAWAARVRMDQTHILAAIRSLGLAAGSVVAKVVPCSAPAEESTTPRNLSANAGRAIRSAAGAIADADLKALFLELAAAAERPSAP